MSLVDALVNISITSGSKAPTVQGFGTPMILSYHTKYASLLKAYTDPAGLLSDGFAATSKTYRMAQSIFSQSPHPPQFFVGRRQTAFTQALQLTLANTNTVSFYTYSFTILDDLGVSWPVTHVGTGVVATDATAIFTQLANTAVTYDHTTSHAFTVSAGYPYLANGTPVTLGGTPPTGFGAAGSATFFMINVTATTFQLSATKGGSVVTATTDDGTTVKLHAGIANCVVTNPSGGVLLFTQTAGSTVDITGMPVPAASGNNGTILFQDLTTDPGIVADVAAIEAIDNTSWYGIVSTSSSKAEVLALAAHVESQTKIFGFVCSDSDQTDNAVTTDLLSQLQALGYTRTLPLYLANETGSMGAAAWIGNRLATQPGAATWAYLSLVGVAVDPNLGGIVNTVTSIAGAHSKSGNVYTSLAGLGATLFGLTPSGIFIDTTIFIDWIRVNMQARILLRQVNASKAGSKIPYTDDGAAQVGMDVAAQLDSGSDKPGGANPGLVQSSINVIIPKVATMSPIDKANRVFGPITFTATTTGALNALSITGNLSF